MFDRQNESVLDLLKERVSKHDFEALSEEHRLSGKPVADVAIELGLISVDALLIHVARAIGCRYVADLPLTIAADVIGAVSAEYARSYGVVPLLVDGQSVEVLAIDPFNERIVSDLSFALGRSVRVVVGQPAAVAMLLKRYYGDDDASVEDVVRGLGGTGETPRKDDELSADDLEAMAGQTPIVRLVNLILGQAIRDHASDVHFEPFEHEYKVRYRVDGTLYEMSPPPRNLALPITSRIKVLANLNIAERRVPQDGRMKLTISGRAVDLRVSTLPTQFGESVVLRVLDQSAVQLSISELGMPAKVVAGLEEIVRRPNGIFIVTGPTGCGKTTTLYSALRLINTPDLKLLTAEDPVEYEIDGIVQVPVTPSVGLTFSATLRSFLRQDPDVIMVGEIRDLETAQIAVQASLTGHLVLSTLHTNDAAGAVTRLTDMGIEPFLIASTLEAVLAQRLVRRVCLKCRVADDRRRDELAAFVSEGVETAKEPTFKAVGCPHCNQTGYRGRTGIYEWLRMTEEIRGLVLSRAPALLIRRQALLEGMEALRENGIRAVLAGATTIEEVVKYT